MVTKRKRGKRESSGSASKDTSGRAASSNTKKKKQDSKSAAKKKEEASSICMLYKLIQQLSKISSNKTSVISTFKALSSANLTPIVSETSLGPLQDGVNVNLILLATYTLNKFLAIDFDEGGDDDGNETTNKNVEVAIAQALIASELSLILMNDKSLLERTMNNTSNASNSLSSSPQNKATPEVGRDAKNVLVKTALTIIISVVSSMKRLSALDRSALPPTVCASASGSKTSGNIIFKIISQTMWKNINTLERMLAVPKRKTPPATSSSMVHIPVTNQHAHSITTHPQRLYEWSLLGAALDNGSISRNENQDDKAELEEMQAQRQEFLTTATECISVQDKNWMMPYIFGTQVAAQLSSSTTSPPAKRKRKSQKNPAISGKEKLEEMLLETKAIEGRITIRKVTSMAFVHCCAGHYHLLDILNNMLEGVNVGLDEVISRGKGKGDDHNADSDFRSQGANLWREIMHPGTMKCDGGKKAKKKKNHEIKVESDRDTGGYLVLNVFASKTIDLIHESGKMCGSVSSKNGTEEYILRRWDAFKDVVGSIESIGAAVSVSPSRASGIKRPNIQNVVIIILRLVLLTHQQCLKGIARAALRSNSPFHISQSQLKSGEEGRVGYILINEEEAMPESLLHEFAFYHPIVNKTIETLIRCVVSTHSPTDFASTKHLYGIASSLALRSSILSHEVGLTGKKGKTDSFVDTVVVVDAKLCSFAVHYLLEAVGAITSFAAKSLSGNENDVNVKELTTPIIEQFLLNEPINPDMTIENASIFVSSAKSENCNFKFQETVVQNGFILGLFLRAMLPGAKKVGKGVTSKSPQALVELLMNAVKCCYNNRHDGAMAGTKAQVCFTRCVLAADCLEAVRQCISSIQYRLDDDCSTKSIAAVRLRASLRKCVSPALSHSFVSLGEILEDSLIHQRLKKFSDTSATKPPSSLLNGASPSKLEFELWERRLWSSHIKCCLAFVRGNADYCTRISTNSSQPKKKSCIGTNNERLSLFKTVASSYPSLGSTKWPLYMSSTHHALVTGNLTCDPLPRTAKEASPERFICEGFIESIIHNLGDPESVILNTEKGDSEIKIQVSDEVVPLSLRDARLFAVAMCRTPKKERMNLLSKFVNGLHSALVGIQSDENLRLLLGTNRAFSSFIARVLTVCSNMVDMISSGTILLESLCVYIGPLRYHLPSFIEIDDKVDGAQQDCGSDWYKRESCFMGLWPDWEMSSLPACHVDTFVEPLSKDDLNKFSSILKTALDLGFETARADMCHLAFAAWNALAKLEGIEYNNWIGMTTADEMASLSNASKLIALRSDVCGLYSELECEQTPSHDTYLSLKLRAKRRKYTNSINRNKGIESLKFGVQESVKMLDNILSASLKEDDHSPGMCVIAEATLGYMSFLSAMFTTTNTELLAALIQRDKNRAKRKNSSLSGDSGDVEEDEGSEDSEHSGGYNDFDDDDDEEEAQMDGITRLHHVCNVLGASPFHPDWLDSSCRLRPGITENAAVELTEVMLKSLTDFGAHAFARYAGLLNKALSKCTKDSENIEIDGVAALAIIRGIRNPDHKSGSSEELNWQKDVSEALNIDIQIIQALSEGLPCKNTHSVKESFTLNASHRIKGKLQDFVAAGSGWVPGISEYRTGGEWELLLSDAIIGACSSINLCREVERTSSELLKADPCINAIFDDALHWKRILQNTISTMVTINALLRFGLNGAKGRNHHQMTSFESDEILSMDKSRLSYQTSPIKQHRSDRTLHEANLSSIRLKTSVSRALSLLAEVQSCGFLSPSMQQSARSAICHLIQKDEDTINLEGVHVIRNAIVAMKVFSNVPTTKSKKTATCECMRKLVACMRSNDLIMNNFETKLLFCLGSPIGIKIDSIAEKCIDMRSLLQNNRNAKIYGEFQDWDWTDIPSQEIQLLVKIVQGQHNDIVDSETRLKVIIYVRDLIRAEDLACGEGSSVKMAIFGQWKNLTASQLQTIFKSDICVLDLNKTMEARKKTNVFDISRSLCGILIQLLGIKTTTKADNQLFKTALKVFKAQMQHWVHEKELNHLICTTCVMAMRFGSIKDVGKNLMRILMSGGIGNEDRDLAALELFYRFLQESSKTSSTEVNYCAEDTTVAPTLGTPSPTTKIDTDDSSTSLKRQTRCSYVSTGGDFTEQHWYNCYTCGLTWDKGCCSLCALVCHKGHDVGYSRKSSFFCDCGAEVRTSVGRLTCKCLSELSPAAIECTYCDDNPPLDTSLDDEKVAEVSSACEEDTCWREAMELLASQFATEVKNSLDDFKVSVDKSVVENLFDTFNTQFDSWVNREKMETIIATGTGVFDHEGRRHKDSSIDNRDGVSLDLSKLEHQSLCLLKGTRSNTLNVKLSTDFSLERSKKVLLAKNAVTRNVMAVDLRGRLIIAESNSLLFCAALPLVNTRHVSNPMESPMDRAQLCILGTKKSDFGAIVGIALCPDRDRRLLTWGFVSVSVHLLNEICDDIDGTIDLNVDLDDSECDSDYIVKAEWITDRVIAIFCATTLKIFDLEANCTEVGPKRYVCQPAANFLSAYDDMLIRAGVVIPVHRQNSEEEGQSLKVHDLVTKKIFLLFDTGRLHMVDLNLKRNGGLVCDGDITIECGDGFPFPISGARRFGGASEPPGTTSRSLGEGSCLVYLKQSRTLLYKCVSSCMVGFVIDDAGEISGSFEFLPHIISSDLTDQVDGGSVSGPYSNWTELGTIERGNNSFYRAAFICRATTTNQPQPMYIEYNQDCSKVKSIRMPHNSSIISSLNSSIEGIAAFSGPIILGNTIEDGSLGSQGSFSERLFLVTVTSSGILSFYGDQLEDKQDKKITEAVSSVHSSRRRALSDSGIVSQKEIVPDRVKFKDLASEGKPLPSFPLTIFETLINVTPAINLIFSGDATEADGALDAKRKLCTGSNEYVVSPSKDGCTFIVSLQRSNSAKGTKNDDKKYYDPTEHAIVAVRVLLGTNNADFVPREIFIMGRPIKPTRDKKRWYDVPLTDEEIMLGVRAGFVSICISGSQDGDRNPALIDAIEVYAKTRSSLPNLFPISVEKDGLRPAPKASNIKTDVEECRQSLDTSILVISHLFQLLGGASGLWSKISEDSLQRLIQVTALDSNTKGSVRNHVIEMLKEVETDSSAMQMLLDKGTIQGICNTLKDLESILAKVHVMDPDSVPISPCIWDKMLVKVNSCLVAAIAIVKERPSNYKHAIECFIASKTARSSIALYSKEFVMKCGDSSLATLTASKLVELIIHEAMSNSVNDVSCAVRNFAGLDAISEMLSLPVENIVKQCCTTVAKVLKDLPAQVLIHVCDCCEALPITKMRYTMDEYDIDLCQECYLKGISYSAMKSYNPDVPVRIDDKVVHVLQNNRDLTCAEICRMTSRTVPEIPKDQIPDLPNADIQSDNHEPMEVDDDEEVQLQIALKMSLESQDESQDASRAITLRSMIFKILLDDVVKNLSSTEKPRVLNTVPIINLLLTLVLQCNRSEDRVELGQKMCKSFCQQIGDLIQPCTDAKSSQLTLRNSRSAIILYLRALHCLMTKKDEISTLQTTPTSMQKMNEISMQPSTNKSKTDPRFICEAHGVPAVRRRCSHGEHKDRRFYVCGMDRKLRCKYFKWADEVNDGKSPLSRIDIGKNLGVLSPNPVGDEKVVVDSMLQAVLWKQLNSGNPPFHKRMCTVLRSFVKRAHAEYLFNSGNEAVPAIPSSLHEKLISTADQGDVESDGGFLVAKKLGYYHQSPDLTLVDDSNSNELSSIEAALDFLSLVATYSSDITHKAYASWEVWYSPLCQIISKDSPPNLRSQAKRMLKCLCGGRKVIYHQIRDRFVFASQFMELLEYCQYPLQAALCVRQKARQCGPQWRQSNITWATLSTGGLIGAKDLISEDNYTVTTMEKISKVLESLANITKSRSENWRHFCALDKLPQKDYDLESDASNVKMQSNDDMNVRSPICLLLWMACSLPSKFQVKLIQLMDVALRDGREASQPKDTIPPATSILEESHGIITTDIGTDAEFGNNATQGRTLSCKDVPENILLAGSSGLTTNDICAFVLHFVLNGKNPELRLHARNIAFRLVTKSTSESMQRFLHRMSSACMGELAAYGTQAAEFLQLLTQIVSNQSCMEGVDTSFLARVSITCFSQQLATNYNVIDSPSNKNSLELMYKKDSTTICETFDLTHCIHCQDQRYENINMKEIRSHGNKENLFSRYNKEEQEGDKKPWAHEQLSSYRRISLDQQHTVSTEFSTYIQLKSRLSISEIFLQVSDQRGRFVKNIAVYFSPRPVNDMNDLRDDHDGPLWQRCGTFTLTRGASNASITLPSDVVAACLKFEYVDFYEKITGPRTSSGAMVLHCPRCTRVVDNAHGGVCGHCGEVAFQCRKCRHINYDRLDAFLCVECGYCSSGTFSYELEAGGATSAVAILSEEDLERSMATLQNRNKKCNELTTALKKLVSTTKESVGGKRKRDTEELFSQSIDSYNSPLKRALFGELPKITINKGGDEEKRESKKGSSSQSRPSAPSASNRARSLLSLARQLRGESGSDVRSSLGDLLVHQARLSSGARSGFAFDEEGDVNLMPFDMPDPLSRLVANIQARARGEAESLSASRSEAESKNGDDTTEKTSKKEANDKMSEEAHKYLNQIRGIRKDCDELQTRIVSWKRLNQDALADQGFSTDFVRYMPTTCQVCAPVVTLHLLELVHAHLQFNMEASEKELHAKFISCLFDGQITDDPNIMELKRAVLVTIAKKSDIGSQMVFKELHVRLNGARDNVSAQILGQLLKNEIKSYDKFVELAVRILNC